MLTTQTRNYVTCFGHICNHPHGQENYTQKYINTILITVQGHIIKVSELLQRFSSLLKGLIRRLRKNVWADGYVPSPLGTGGAGIHAVCGRCSSSSSLSYSAGPVTSSFSAESFALVHGLEWCHSHLKSCHFQSARFLTDSQSALTLLS